MGFTFHNGRTVRRLGFGAMRLRRADLDHDTALLRRAVELGVDHIDTARMYGQGRNEALVAAALHPYPPGLLIATKGGIESTDTWYRNDGSPAALRRHVEESLRRLRCEQLGLYYLHDPDPQVAIAESVGALAELRDEGKIELIGVSNVDVDQLREAAETTTIAAVQNRYSAGGGGDEAVFALTRQLGIAFVPWGPLRHTPPRGAGRGSDAQRALAALLDLAPHVLPIPGTGSLAHLEENMSVAAPAAGNRPPPGEVSIQW